MIFSRIRTLGRTFDVFPSSVIPTEPERYRDSTDTAATVFLLPSLDSDIRVIHLDEKGKNGGLSLAPALAATVFLIAERGLPLDEISVEAPDGIFDTMKLGKDGKYCVRLPKCKLLCSNMMKNVKNAEISFCDVMVFDKRVRVIQCMDAERFLPENMPLLVLDDKSVRADVVAVASAVEKELTVKSYSLSAGVSDYLYAAIAAHRILCRDDAVVFSSDVELEFIKYEGKIFITSPYTPPMTFTAPDIVF